MCSPFHPQKTTHPPTLTQPVLLLPFSSLPHHNWSWTQHHHHTHTARPPLPFFFSPQHIWSWRKLPFSLSSWDSCSVHNLFDKMSQWACVSAANLSCQASIINTQKLRNTPRCDAFSFKGSEFMAQSCRFLSPQAIHGRPRNGACPLKVCFLYKYEWFSC